MLSLYYLCYQARRALHDFPSSEQGHRDDNAEHDYDEVAAVLADDTDESVNYDYNSPGQVLLELLQSTDNRCDLFSRHVAGACKDP